MNETVEAFPPVGVEQWLDFIIASASHRSHVEEQRKFGDMLIQRYFVTLPERYREDKTATLYFDNILPAVASAIRGFSVVRDTFQTRWDEIKAIQDWNVEYAKTLDRFSPLKKEGHWGKAFTVVIASGLGVLASHVIRRAFENWLPVTILMVFVVAIVLLLAIQALVEWLRNHQVRRFHMQYPEDLLAYWSDYSLNGYRKVARQFLPIAVEVTKRYYPNDNTLSAYSTDKLDEIVDKHFAFKPRAKNVQPATDPQKTVMNTSS